MSYPASIIKYMFDTKSGDIAPTVTFSPHPAGAAPTTSPDPDAGPDSVPLERLESQLCELAGHLAAATCRSLVLLGDFDARKGWADWEMTSCAQGLSWKCQLSSGTAREHVRVARALRDLPVLRAEFAAARLSYAKVRALTRIATPATEAGLAEIAGPMTANQLERFARAHRQVSHADDDAARLGRRLSWRFEEDGTLSGTFRLPPAAGAVFLQSLRAAAGYLDPRPHDDDHDKNPGHDKDPGGVPAETPATPRVPGHPADPGRCHVQDGPAISVSTAQMIGCTAALAWLLHDRDGTALDAGRKRRYATTAQRRAARDRDKCRCRFPGCEARRTDLHHIRHWANGGRTSLENRCPTARRCPTRRGASGTGTTPRSPPTPSSRCGTASAWTWTSPSTPASPTPKTRRSKPPAARPAGTRTHLTQIKVRRLTQKHGA
jgi:hypothetical protein